MRPISSIMVIAGLLVGLSCRQETAPAPQPAARPAGARSSSATSLWKSRTRSASGGRDLRQVCPHEPRGPTESVPNPRLANKPVAKLLVGGARGGGDLEGDPLPELGVVGQVDRPHSPVTEDALDDVTTSDFGAGTQLHPGSLHSVLMGRLERGSH